MTTIVSLTDGFREAQLLDKIACGEALSDLEQEFLERLRERRELEQVGNGDQP